MQPPPPSPSKVSSCHHAAITFRIKLSAFCSKLLDELVSVRHTRPGRGIRERIHLCRDIWVFPKIGVGPQNGWFIMDDLGGKPHYFRTHPYKQAMEKFLIHLEEETWYSLGWAIFLLMIPTVRMVWWKSLGWWSSQKCTMSFMSFRWSGSLWRYHPYLPSILKTPQLKTQVQVPRLRLFVSTMFIPFLRLKNSLFHHFRVPHESKKSHMVI